MDVLVLIDKLDDLVHNAKAVPLTDQVRIDREEIYDILDQMRATIPEEIKQARWIVKERQEMLAEAKREAERIVKEAHDEQNRLIGEEEVVKQAERQAEDIVEDARAREREIRLGAEDYADVVKTLEVNLQKFIAPSSRREQLQGAKRRKSSGGVTRRCRESVRLRRGDLRSVSPRRRNFRRLTVESTFVFGGEATRRPRQVDSRSMPRVGQKLVCRRASTRLHGVCARCLEDVDLPGGDGVGTWLKAIAGVGWEAYVLAISYGRTAGLATSPTLPAQLLCRPDCRGLYRVRGEPQRGRCATGPQ
jgi:hypothetical protein